MTKEDSMSEVIAEARRLREVLQGRALEIRAYSTQLKSRADQLSEEVQAPQERPDDGAR